MAEITVTENNFEEEVLKSEKPVLLDFWATWCGPCRMVAPILAQFAEDNDSVKVGKINVDEQPALAAQFGIVSIPTLILMKEGKIAVKRIGYQTKDQLESMVS